jgi:polyhydroxyalkanoate synthesis regulator phasin
MNKKAGQLLLSLPFVFASTAGVAANTEEMLQLKNTVTNLVDELVKAGVLKKEQAEAMVKRAEEAAAAEAKEQAASAPPADNAAQQLAEETGSPEVADANVVRVPYVPEFVKDEIREEVRKELKNDVVKEVTDKAKQEKWGTPDALPKWVNKIKITGDVRLREELDLMADENIDIVGPLGYYDALEVNDAGGFINCTDDFPFCRINTEEDRNRFRARARIGLQAKITDNLKFGARLATSNDFSPVSTNQTLGNTGEGYQVQLDHVFLQYDGVKNGMNWGTFAVGRIPSPWFSTDMVWDEDLSFEGAAMTLRYSVAGKGDLMAMQDKSKQMFMTLGAFPIDEFELSGRDKWLAGAQMGADLEFSNQTKFKLGVAYYDFINLTGQQNSLGSTEKNFTAPEFVQKGNLLFDIASPDGVNVPLETDLLALAADYNLVNITGEIDFAHLAPYHVILGFDVVKNVGYDEDEIRDRVANSEFVTRAGGSTIGLIEDRTWGYSADLLVGWPQMNKLWDWQVFGSYKYLQRDAVLDAFTDSDFHLGGTDAQGYIIGGKLGLAKDVWLRGRWLSANEIDASPLGIDVLQLDLNAKF